MRDFNMQNYTVLNTARNSMGEDIGVFKHIDQTVDNVTYGLIIIFPEKVIALLDK